MGAFATRALQATPAAAGDAPVAPAAAATTSKPAQKPVVPALPLPYVKRQAAAASASTNPSKPESNGDETKPQGKQHKPETSKSRKDENSKNNVHYAVATAPTRFRCKVGGEWKDLSVFSNAQQRTLRYLPASGQPAPRSRALRTRPEQLASHNAKQYARVFIQHSEPRDVEYCHQA
ncbi:hypothetical protein ACQRIU_000143 [Beauveria bassiana]